MRTPTRPLALLAALGAAVALAGCSGGGDEATTVPGGGGGEATSVPPSSVETTKPAETVAPPQTEPVGPAELTAAVDDGAGGSTTHTLTCEPTGGDVATAQAACEQLATVGTLVFAPVAPDQMCTQVYGGPQTATITGTVNGQPVESTFSRVNGCEIARWDAISGLLGEVADANS